MTARTAVNRNVMITDRSAWESRHRCETKAGGARSIAADKAGTGQKRLTASENSNGGRPVLFPLVRRQQGWEAGRLSARQPPAVWRRRPERDRPWSR